MTEILAYTATYELLARPLGVLDGENPNLVRYLFADPRARKAFPDWERIADEQPDPPSRPPTSICRASATS